jgi:RND family efflux transporter MFP subunit
MFNFVGPSVSPKAKYTRIVSLLHWRSALVGATIAAQIAVSGCGQLADAQSSPPPAPPVSVVPAIQRSVNDLEEFSGRLEAVDFVELHPRVSGTIEAVHFIDGAIVRKGELLFSIDPRPFLAELGRAQSQLTVSKARFELAQTEFARARALLDQEAASKQEFDQLASSLRTSLADIQGAESALRLAQLNLDYTQVRSPIAGHASRANITVGNLVDEQSALTSIAGVSRVYAYFDGSEQTFLRLQALKANESSYLHEGELDFVDNRLNPQTGAVRLRASFDNANGQFTPGLAARLRMQSPVAYDAVMVPERAIGTDQTKKFVYVVAADGKPLFREVIPGALFDGMRVLKSGVKAGENVIVDGLQRVRPGVAVSPQLLEIDALGMPIPVPPRSAASASVATR